MVPASSWMRVQAAPFIAATNSGPVLQQAARHTYIIQAAPPYPSQSVTGCCCCFSSSIVVVVVPGHADASSAHELLLEVVLGHTDRQGHHRHASSVRPPEDDDDTGRALAACRPTWRRERWLSAGPCRARPARRAAWAASSRRAGCPGLPGRPCCCRRCHRARPGRCQCCHRCRA